MTMMITKFLIASLLFSLLALQLAEADRDTVSSNLAASSPPKKIALARRGASYPLGLDCAIEHVGLAVQDAAVFLQEQPRLFLAFLLSPYALSSSKSDQNESCKLHRGIDILSQE
ncbi:hypothetical protein SADUNF_Sadunf05G0180900 [Salix dunnii]|uniref:Uncharacterized protein n=1 Tax=Salix dunnii TaxID=1413687 RepID=A0A835N3S2_9ROSI|nr:hypothetical protein SADUNF_Sadunf05G0180900 [Salix dunnii]